MVRWPTTWSIQQPRVTADHSLAKLQGNGARATAGRYHLELTSQSHTPSQNYPHPDTDHCSPIHWTENSLDKYHGNGRITCAEPRAHPIPPVRRGHPAYKYISPQFHRGPKYRPYRNAATFGTVQLLKWPSAAVSTAPAPSGTATGTRPTGRSTRPPPPTLNTPKLTQPRRIRQTTLTS